MTVHNTGDNFDKAIAIAEKARLIVDHEEAKAFLDTCPETCALDFETTSLSPRIGKVRLSCFYHPECGAVIIDHEFAGSFESLVDHYMRCEWIVYNAKFEVRWFDHFRPEQVTLTDVDYLAKSKLGGYASSLARMCKRDLGVDLDKTLQTSDWSKLKLTDHQYTYGASDSVLTWMLYEYWQGEITDEQFRAGEVWQDVVRPTVECEEVGLYLNTYAHVENIAVWEMKLENARRCLRRMVPKSALDNLNSNAQVSQFIKSQLDNKSLAAWPTTGVREYLSLERKTLAPIAARASYPFSRWLNALILYRYYSKYLSTYGDSLVFKQKADGRITSRFNIAQATTARYSSAATNLQNIPRKVYIRKAFTIPPRSGLVMVLADYKGVEIRVLAELSDDAQLRQDCIYGDVHSSSAATIYHIDLDVFLEIVNDKTHPRYLEFKEMRSKAKGFTFQLLYGAGDAALSLVLKCSIAEAADAVRKWAARYPKAYAYRHKIFDEMNKTGFIPIVGGRTIYVRRPDRTMPVAANYGVQGAAGDVVCRAMTRVYRRNKDHKTEARLAACVHDELLEYCPVETSEKALEDLALGMEEGWLDVFPGTDTANLTDAVIGTTWADKP